MHVRAILEILASEQIYLIFNYAFFSVIHLQLRLHARKHIFPSQLSVQQ